MSTRVDPSKWKSVSEIDWSEVYREESKKISSKVILPVIEDYYGEVYTESYQFHPLDTTLGYLKESCKKNGQYLCFIQDDFYKKSLPMSILRYDGKNVFVDDGEIICGIPVVDLPHMTDQDGIIMKLDYFEKHAEQIADSVEKNNYFLTENEDTIACAYDMSYMRISDMRFRYGKDNLRMCIFSKSFLHNTSEFEVRLHNMNSPLDFDGSDDYPELVKDEKMDWAYNSKILHVQKSPDHLGITRWIRRFILGDV